MQVRIAVLADYASISLGNKLNIMGIFKNMTAQSAPYCHPQMQLVARFEFDSSEVGNKDLRIELVDEDGKQIFSVSGELRIERSPDGSPATANNVLCLNNMVFPKFGEYEFRILLNDRTEATIPLTVAKAQPSPDSN